MYFIGHYVFFLHLGGYSEWKNSGATSGLLCVGDHTIEFRDISGWTKPGNQTVSLEKDQTATVSGTYTQQNGSVKVTISPSAAVSAGAQWRVDSGSWHNSGYTQSDIVVGTHTVAFRSISGWTAPGSKSVTIENGQTTSTSGTYTQQTGSLTVTIDPSAARSAGAQWRVVDGDTWHNSGDTQSGLAVGDHTVEYKAISGWATPGNQIVTIENNQNTNTTGIYTKETGSLKVTIEPSEALAAGAQWRVDGGSWHSSGDTESGLAVGNHTVDYKVLSGWTEPEGMMVIVNEGETTLVNATYSDASQPITTGALKVTISPPEAISAGAQWRVDDGSWHSSGDTQSGVAEGSHTLEFKDIASWSKPGNQQVTITSGETETISAAYTQKTGALQVMLSPSEVVSVGAQWRVDGGVWHDSGDMETNLSIGNHIMECNDVSGWITPTDQEITITEDQTTTITETYEKDETVEPEGGNESGDSGDDGGGGGCFVSSMIWSF